MIDDIFDKFSFVADWFVRMDEKGWLVWMGVGVVLVVLFLLLRG